MVKESDPTLGNNFWLPYIQPNQTEMMNWIHSETGQIGNLTWRRGQVNKFIILLYLISIHN